LPFNVATPSVLTREAGTSAPTTRSARYRPSLSHIAIALAALLAFGLNFLALQNREATSLVAVAAAPLAEGTQFGLESVRLESLPADFAGIEHLVVEEDVATLEGWIVARSMAEGEPIGRSDLIRPGAEGGLRTMSIPVPMEHAAGATVVVGDRVDVISMVGDSPAFVATDLEVVSVGESTQTGLTVAGPYHVVVAVDTEEALALARAITEGSVELLRSTGAAAIGEGEG
jgi:Flp pilus assembly protein CpaB